MNLNALHRRLLQDILEIGNAFPFVITGGYAVQAHGLVDRWSRDIDVATNSPVPMAALAEHDIDRRLYAENYDDNQEDDSL
jgi:hypothetical protein